MSVNVTEDEVFADMQESIRRLSLRELIDTAKSFHANSRSPRYSDGTCMSRCAPIYDAQMFYLVVPELIARLQNVLDRQEEGEAAMRKVHGLIESPGEPTEALVALMRGKP